MLRQKKHFVVGIFKVVLKTILCFYFVSCSKQTIDPTSSTKAKPVISVISKNASTVSEFLCNTQFDNVLKVKSGTTLYFQFKFEGVQKLSQYKIDIHNNFDCHTHGRKESTHVRLASSSPWKVLKIGNLSEREVLVSDTLTIPMDAAAGNYHFIVQLLDELGNEATPLEFNLILSNQKDSIPPEINLTNPAIDSVSIAVGSKLNIAATITDNISLNGGSVEVLFKDALGNRFDIHQLFLPISQGESFPLTFEYTIPSYSVKGKSIFYVKAYDEFNNLATKSFKVYIY